MPVTPDDIDAMPTFTAAQLLAQVEHAIVQLVAGATSYSINGRSVTKADLGELRKWRDDLRHEVVASDEGFNGGVALATFVRPR